MKVIYKQDKLNNVPTAWDKQYKVNGTFTDIRKKKISEELWALEQPIKKELVETIIGNDSWTNFECDVCNKTVDKLVYIEPYNYDEYENRGMYICKKCLNKAKKVIKG